MMMRFLRMPHVGRFFSSVAVVAIIAVVTGPPGSTATPTAGFTGSFTEKTSFFGLFATARYLEFFVFVLLLFGAWTLWVSRGEQLKAVTSKALGAPRAVAQHKPVKWGLRLLLVVVAIVLPHIVTDPFWQAAMVEQLAIFVLLALGLNVVVGFAGLLDLGFVAFYAIGAYVTAWVTGALPTPAPFGIHLNTRCV